MQERLPDARVDATQEQLPDERHAPSAGVSFSLGRFSLTSGILPLPPRAGFTVRACSSVCVDKQKRSISDAAGIRKLLL